VFYRLRFFVKALPIYLCVLQGNEYFQRKSYLTALREYTVSVLSAPSTDTISVDSTCQHSAAESSGDGKPEPVMDNSSGGDTSKPVDEDAENKSPEVVAVDESASSVEPKSTGDGVKEDKGGNKNELALAYANRFC